MRVWYLNKSKWGRFAPPHYAVSSAPARTPARRFGSYGAEASNGPDKCREREPFTRSSTSLPSGCDEPVP